MYLPFAETRFLIGVPKSSGGYGFKVNVVRAGSGMEQRVEHNLNPNFPGLENEPMYEGDLGNLVVTQCELDYVTNFFNARRGKSQGFRFKNWADYTCTYLPDYGHKGEENDTYTQGITYPAIADGVNRNFKAVKLYSSAGEVTLKSLHKLVAGTVKVYVNGVLTPAPFVDVNTGFFVFPSAPTLGAVITHNCEFDLPVRFDTDEMIGASEFHDKETGRLCYTYGGLPIVEYSQRITLPATPPFLGGQCNTIYEVITEIQATWRFISEPKDIISVRQIQFRNFARGRIRGIEILSGEWTLATTGSNYFGFNASILASNEDGTPNSTQGGAGNNGFGGNIVSEAGDPYVRPGRAFEARTDSARIVSVTRVDGLSDDCGNISSVF